MKSPALVAVLPATVTVMGPVVAPPGTVTIRLVVLPDVTAAVVPLNFTRLLPGVGSKLVPVMVTVVPMGPLLGVKPVMVGGTRKAKPVSVPVPPGVVTETIPELPAPTTASMEVGEFTVNELAVVPPKLTVVAPIKLVPVIVTVAPAAALVGLNDVMVGTPPPSRTLSL